MGRQVAFMLPLRAQQINKSWITLINPYTELGSDCRLSPARAVCWGIKRYNKLHIIYENIKKDLQKWAS